MPKKNIMMDMAFTIETEKEFDELTQTEVIGAVLGRVQQLLKCWEGDAIGFCDEYEIKE